MGCVFVFSAFVGFEVLNTFLAAFTPSLDGKEIGLEALGRE